MGLWAKLHTEILDDPKLIRAARMGAQQLELLPWLIAFAKRADDDGRLSVAGLPAEPIDIARSVPGITAKRVARCISELVAIGILVQDEGFLRFFQWEKRSGHGKTKPSDTPERVRERVSRHRAKTQVVDAPHSSNGVTPHVTPLVTPVKRGMKRPLDVDVDVERDKERRAESVTPRVSASANDEPGSAAALVAPLPNCEEPRDEWVNAAGEHVGMYGHDAPKVDYPTIASDQPLPTNLERLEDLPTERRVMTEAEVRERFETPANSPNGKHEPPSALDVVLPHAAVRFGKTFYPRGTATDARRTDVFEQLTAVLTKPGLAFNGGIIHVTPARLSAACLAVLKSHEKGPLENPDSAIVYLLTKLSDVSQDSPTEKAAVEAKVEEQNDRMTFAERRERALKIAAERPEEHQRLTEAAKRIFPGKDKDMEQPRLAYVITQLLRLETVAT